MSFENHLNISSVAESMALNDGSETLNHVFTAEDSADRVGLWCFILDSCQMTALFSDICSNKSAERKTIRSI